MQGRIRLLAFSTGAVMLAAAPGAVSQVSTTPMASQDEVAETIVTTAAGIRYDEVVLIHGSPRDQEMLENLAVQVRKLGAHPLVTISSDRLARMLFTDVPAQFDSQQPKFLMKMADLIDAEISVAVQEKPDLLADITPSRIAERNKAFEPVYERMLERGVVQVQLGNGLYPTKSLARQFQISQDQLASIFWNGVNVDGTVLARQGQWISNQLATGGVVRITAPNGTDLTVEIPKRPVFVSDGVVTSEDRYAGGPACQVWLPAGEVYLTPKPRTADGTFVADTFFFQGKLIEDLTLTFKKGRLTTFSGKGDISALRKMYDAAPKNRDQFAFLDIGFNPKVQAPPRSRLVSWVAAGTITIGVGNNVWAGGDNDVPFDLAAHLNGGTLTLDDTTIVDQGTIVASK